MDTLFNEDHLKRKHIGKTELSYKNTSSILTKASGFMNDYDYTLNPYSGCSFGCKYCYAAFFSRSEEKRDNWGYWIDVKENALSLLIKYRKKPLIGKTIYISSVTDPYQPIEKELELTRSLLNELNKYHRPIIVIQTRSPLVTRDIDVFKNFERIQINMTVTTDSEEVRRIFEPFCPSNKVRLEAIKEINNSGLDACITMTPLLPVKDAEKFAKELVDTGIKKFIVQPFHPDRGKFIASTREQAIKLVKEMKWDMEKYKKVVEVFRKHLPDLGEGKEGFSIS